ncbi:MAG: hypothetical protein RL213_92 [Bacteroidota bacterium]
MFTDFITSLRSVRQVLFPVAGLLLSSGSVAETVKFFDASQGATFNYVNDLVRDGDGIFWLATEKGIVRFDGANFFVLDAERASVSALRLFDEHLYILYGEKPAVRMDIHRLTRTQVSTEPLKDLVELSEERLLQLTESGRLVKAVRGRELLSKKWHRGPLPGFIHSFAGKVLCGSSERGLCQLDTSTLEAAFFIPFGLLNTRQDLVEYGDSLYLTNDDTVFVISRDLKIRRMDELPRNISELRISRFMPVPGGGVFIANAISLMELRNGRLHKVYEPKRGNYEFRDFFRLDDLSYLVGTNQGVFLLDLHPPPISRLPDETVVPTNQIRIRRRVLSLDDGDLLLLGNPFVFRIDSADGIKIVDKEFSELSSIDAVRAGDDYYFTTEGLGVIRWNLKTDRFEKLPLSDKTFVLSEYAIFHDPVLNRLLIGSTDGLLVFNLDEGTAYKPEVPFSGQMVRVIRQEPSTGNFFVCTSSGLYCLDKSLRPVKRFNGREVYRPGVSIADLLFHSDGRQVYVAHTEGADQLDRASWTLLRGFGPEELIDERVVALLEDLYGRVWMSTYSGIIAFDAKTRESISLNRSNGLVNSEYNYFSAARLPDGRLVFGGLNGYDVIDPGKFDFQSKGDVGIISGYRMIDFLGRDSSDFMVGQPEELTLDFEKSYLRIFLTSADLLHAGSYGYEYSFDGQNWLPVSGTYVDVLNLPPGEHLLRLRARNLYGKNILFEPVRIRSTIPFYKTRSYIVLISVVSLLSFMVVVWVVFQNRRRQQLDRERISMDLHDEVGTLLTRTLYMSRSGMKFSEKALQDQLQEALFSLRVHINTLQRRSFPLTRLADEIRETFQQTLRPSGAEVVVEITMDKDYGVTVDSYRNIRLALFEISTNILKHTLASKVLLRLRSGQGRLHIFVQDDGQVSELSSIFGKGQGVGNIRTRLQSVGGRVDFRISEGGHGLTVEADVPLND